MALARGESTSFASEAEQQATDLLDQPDHRGALAGVWGRRRRVPDRYGPIFTHGRVHVEQQRYGGHHRGVLHEERALLSVRDRLERARAHRVPIQARGPTDANNIHLTGWYKNAQDGSPESYSSAFNANFVVADHAGSGEVHGADLGSSARVQFLFRPGSEHGWRLRRDRERAERRVPLSRNRASPASRDIFA